MTVPDSKYEIGQNVYFIDDDGRVISGVISNAQYIGEMGGWIYTFRFGPSHTPMIPEDRILG